MPQYTNEITPEIIHTLNNPYSERDLATFRETESKFITNELSKRTVATVVAIYRHATGGAQTRNGGTLRNTSARSCILDDGDIIVSTPQGVRMLVEYDDMRFGDDFLKPEA